jgi:hypothetical protein
MSISVGQIALHSKDIQKCSSFLSDLLDTEIIPAGDAVRLVHKSFTIVVIDGSDNKIESSANLTVIDFFVDSIQELEDLRQKYLFFHYRENSIEASCELRTIGPISFFVIVDPDGRKWKFSYRNI